MKPSAAPASKWRINSSAICSAVPAHCGTKPTLVPYRRPSSAKVSSSACIAAANMCSCVGTLRSCRSRRIVVIGVSNGYSAKLMPV
ncbi:Uncharacterised protein [Mycobacteroides abscessus subsp. abscessus]|nr:Uncharacterised protein [Mycobacteroides abscessus subsp. abscessus]